MYEKYRIEKENVWSDERKTKYAGFRQYYIDSSFSPIEPLFSVVYICLWKPQFKTRRVASGTRDGRVAGWGTQPLTAQISPHEGQGGGGNSVVRAQAEL